MTDFLGDESPLEGETKYCAGCQKRKPLFDFTLRTSKGGYFALCKRCRALRAAFNRDTERERIAKAHYRATHREQVRTYSRKRHQLEKRKRFEEVVKQLGRVDQ